MKNKAIIVSLFSSAVLLIGADYPVQAEKVSENYVPSQQEVVTANETKSESSEHLVSAGVKSAPQVNDKAKNASPVNEKAKNTPQVSDKAQSTHPVNNKAERTFQDNNQAYQNLNNENNKITTKEAVSLDKKPEKSEQADQKNRRSPVDHSKDATSQNDQVLNNNKVVQDQEEIGYWDQFQLKHEASFADDLTILKGDTYTYQLPNLVKIPHQKTFDVLNADGKVSGEGIANPAKNQVQVTFSDFFEKNPLNKKIVIYVDAVWNKEKVSPSSIQEIAGTKIKVGENKGIDPNEILYQYGYITDKAADTIQWVARLNYAKKDHKNLTYRVEVPKGQTLIKDSIEIIEAAINPSGNGYKVVRYLKPADVVQLTNHGMIVNLKNTNKSYIINYKTLALDGGVSSQYYNTVQVNDNEKVNVYTPKVEAGAEVSGEKKSIAKKPSLPSKPTSCRPVCYNFVWNYFIKQLYYTQCYFAQLQNWMFSNFHPYCFRPVRVTCWTLPMKLVKASLFYTNKINWWI